MLTLPHGADVKSDTAGIRQWKISKVNVAQNKQPRVPLRRNRNTSQNLGSQVNAQWYSNSVKYEVKHRPAICIRHLPAMERRNKVAAPHCRKNASSRRRGSCRPRLISQQNKPHNNGDAATRQRHVSPYPQTRQWIPRSDKYCAVHPRNDRPQMNSNALSQRRPTS